MRPEWSFIAILPPRIVQIELDCSELASDLRDDACFLSLDPIIIVIHPKLTHFRG